MLQNCHPQVVDHINQHYVAWGGDIRFSDAYRVSRLKA